MIEKQNSRRRLTLINSVGLTSTTQTKTPASKSAATHLFDLEDLPPKVQLMFTVLEVPTWQSRSCFLVTYFSRKTHSCVKACDLSRQKQTPGEQKWMCIKVHVTCSSRECLWQGKAFVRPTNHWWYSEKHERTGKRTMEGQSCTTRNN